MANPSEHDPTLTHHGFIRAAHLTDETLQAIIDTIAEGTVEGPACRQHGTSYTQFLSRVRKDPEWHSKLRAAEVLKMRVLRQQARNLQSQHGGPHTIP